MTREDVSKIVLHIAEKYYCEVAKESDSLEWDLQLDSLDTLEFLMDLEIEFNIEIDNDKAKEAKTLADIIDFINKEEKK